jgi:Protein of unknown function (DUF1360)
MTSVLSARRREDSYDPKGEVDVRGYAGSLATYSAVVAVIAGAARGSSSAVEQYAVSDVVIGGLATHKFSRLLARGSVTSPVRAPFTRFDSAAGSSEHDERPRAEQGYRKTVGELLTCPFCVGVWIGTAYVAGLTLAPRASRAWAATFAVVGLSDFLQHAYGRVRQS